MARFTFVNRHYWPETASTGQHLTDLCEHLAEAGHHVRVICGSARLATGDAAPQREVHSGVEVVRVGAAPVGGRRDSLLRRIGSYARFHLAAGLRILCERHAEVLVTLTTPPLLGFWGSLAQKLGGPKHVCFLMDHHPDAEFESGMLRRESIAGRFVESLYRWTLTRATRCVALGEYQARRVLARDVDPERVEIIPIWSRAADIPECLLEANPLRERLGWNGRFVVMYSGNAGRVHRFEELLLAIETLAETTPEVLFAFVGGGPRRPEIEAFVRERGLGNVEFHDSVPRAELGHLLTAPNAHVVTLREEQVGVSVPGKLYGQLASARPVLFVGPGQCETADDLRAARAGYTFCPGEERALAAAVRLLSANPEAWARLGACGRSWFLQERESHTSCMAWRELLEGLLATPAELPERVLVALPSRRAETASRRAAA